jgi:mannose-6-phosphate isomerase-like protein (cupin superfamily)
VEGDGGLGAGAEDGSGGGTAARETRMAVREPAAVSRARSSGVRRGRPSAKLPGMTNVPDEHRRGSPLPVAEPFDVEAVKRRLAEAGGGYEVVHDSPGLELGVYVLVAPEPDRQQPHADDEVYVVLEGSGMLEVEGRQIELREGNAAFVPAGADHRFSAYEHLSVLVIFERRPA